MKLVDTNILLYAVDSTADHHDQARSWLEAQISSGSRLLFPWLVLVAFVRLTTGRAAMTNPLTAEQAVLLIEEWLKPAGSIVPTPSPDHLARWRALIEATGAGGNIVNDAHLAALALEYDAAVVSFDNDFSRFPGVRWEQPE